MPSYRSIARQMAELLGLPAWAGNEMIEYLQRENVDLLKKTPNVGRGKGGGRGDVLQAHSADAAFLFLALSTGLSPTKAAERGLRLYRLPYQVSWVERETDGRREQLPSRDATGAGGEFLSSPLFGQFLSAHIHTYRRATLENDPDLARLPGDLRNFYLQKRSLFTEISLLRHLFPDGVVWSGQASMVLPRNRFGLRSDKTTPVLHYFVVEYRDVEEHRVDMFDQFKIRDSISWDGAWLVKAAEMLGPLTPDTVIADSEYDFATHNAVHVPVSN